jgi:hypothetical protein
VLIEGNLYNPCLAKLIAKGILKSYKIENLDDEGNVGKSAGRNTERVTLEFPSGEKLVIGTFCSGCLENTVLDFDLGD